MSCTHYDAPRTNYTRLAGQQIASNTPGAAVNGNSADYVNVEFLGALCDPCARAAGLTPVAFLRPLEVTPE